MHDHRLRSLPGPLLLFLLVLSVFALASGLETFIGFLRHGRAGLHYLWMVNPGFDFYDYTPRFPYLHTQKFFTLTAAFPWVYPAPAIFVLYPFYLFATPTHWFPAYALFASASALANGWLATRFGSALQRAGLTGRRVLLMLGVAALLGWPLYFSLQRGNIESLVWVAIAVSVACLATDRLGAGALLLGVFGAIKIYPLLFLALLLRAERIRYLALGLLAALVTTLAGLSFLEPDALAAWRQISAGVRTWTQLTALTYGITGSQTTGIGTDHSLLGLLRQCTHGGVVQSPQALDVYLCVAGVIASAVFLLRVRWLPGPNQALFLACSAILLPPTSYDYTLVLMLIPWGWLTLLCVKKAGAGQDLRQFLLPMCLFGAALAPLTFLHSYDGQNVYFEGPVRSVFLLALAVCAVLRPFRIDDTVKVTGPTSAS